MASQSDKIAPVPEVETKTAVYLGSQQADSASDEGHDAEKQAISERPELKRKLKSRHLQMIAIGMPLHRHSSASSFDTNSLRWHNRHRSLHRERWSNRQIRTSRSAHRLHLRGHHRVFSHDFAGRNGDLHSHFWSIHELRSSLHRSEFRVFHGLDLLVFLGHYLCFGTHRHWSYHPVLE